MKMLGTEERNVGETMGKSWKILTTSNNSMAVSSLAGNIDNKWVDFPADHESNDYEAGRSCEYKVAHQKCKLVCEPHRCDSSTIDRLGRL